MTYYTYMDSPIERLMLVSDGTCLTGLLMVEHKHGPAIEPHWKPDDTAEPFAETKRQLEAYFGGRLTQFNLPIKQQGTDFQRKVWKELMNIPFGETISYGELARRVGNPNASRAVGLANGQNPISIIVPCHRVIGANGKLVGYGGGLGRKEILLQLERSAVSNQPRAPSLADLWTAD